MGNELQVNHKQFFASDAVTKKFEELLGKESRGFVAAVLQIVNSSYQLQKADSQSLYMAAATAATLQLPIQSSLGYAYIVPYKGQAQFQIGWKGFVQLAQRSGQYSKINVIEVYKSQFKSFNAMTEELDADFTKDASGEIVGYCAYIKLINGFEKTSYWTKDKVVKHAMKYSQAYKSEKGITPWKDVDQFHEMAKKTVLKNTLSKWGPMSIEMQKAVVFDQGVVEDIEHEVVNYPDITPNINHERERVLDLLKEEFESLEQFQTNVVDKLSDELKDELAFEIEEKKESLKSK